MAGELLKASDVIKIGQRLEIGMASREEACTSRIENITDKELVIAMPLTDKLTPIILTRGEQVYVLIIGQKCRYRFFATFLHAGKEDGVLPVWHITKPEKVERHQNREFVRVEIGLEARVSLINKDGIIAEPVKTRTFDISGSGVSFLMEKKIPVGYQAAIEIYNIPEIGNLENLGHVAQCRAIERWDGKVIYCVGLAFDCLPRATMNKLIRYLFSVQREQIARRVH